MSANSKIQWTDDTWNWSIGCTKVSPGCTNCYAEVSTPVRVHRAQGRELWGGKLRQRASAATFNAPLAWNKKPWICESCGRADDKHYDHSCTGKPEDACHTKNVKWHRRRVFSLSLGDWLDEAIPIETLADALDVIRRCPNLDFLLLTKRPENWRILMSKVSYFLLRKSADLKGNPKRSEVAATQNMIEDWLGDVAPKNVWIGTTVENQKYADIREPELLKIPAVCRFLSYEPALGPIEHSDVSRRSDAVEQLGKKALNGIHWVIIGGESGPHARPFNVAWARSTVAQCKAAGVACFVKQMGAMALITIGGVSGEFELKDKKGGNSEEWPPDIRVREWPSINVR